MPIPDAFDLVYPCNSVVIKKEIQRLFNQQGADMASVITQYTQEKINHIKSQIQQGELEIFNHELIVKDSEVKTGDPKTDNTFQTQADNSRSTIKFWERKLSVRKTILAELEATLATLNASKPVTE